MRVHHHRSDTYYLEPARPRLPYIANQSRRVSARPAGRGSEEDPIVIGSPTPSPSRPGGSQPTETRTKKPRREKRRYNTRIDQLSGRIKKLSPRSLRRASYVSTTLMAPELLLDCNTPIWQTLTALSRSNPRRQTFDPLVAPPNLDIPFHIQHSIFTTVQSLAEHGRYRGAYPFRSALSRA